MKNIEELKDIIDRFYSKYSDVTEVEDILLSCGASEDDSSDEGYFAGMTDSQIETCYNKIRDMIKYRHENINPDYFTEDTLVDFDLQDLVLPESFSIYEQMNKIDDAESLDEKWNVKNQRKLNRLEEGAENMSLNESGSVDRLYSATDLIDGEYEEIPSYSTVPRSTWDGKWVLAHHNGNDWVFYTRRADFDSDLAKAARFDSRQDALWRRDSVNQKYKKLTDYRANFIAIKSNSKRLQED